MKHWALLLSLLAAPLALAAPFQPATIPADAQWYLHGDLTGLRKTTIGGILLKELRKSEAAKLADIQSLFGFDILTDLSDVTLFGNGKEDQAAIMLTGKLGRANLEKIITQADSYQTSVHRSTTIHHWHDDGKTQHAAFHDDETVIISEQRGLVTLAVDVLAKNKPSLKLEKPLPSTNPVVVAFANLTKIEMPLEEGSRIIRKAETLFVTLGEKDERLTTNLIVEASSEKVARQMMHVLQGAVSLGELAEQKIEDLDIRHSGNVEGKTMTMSMNLSVAKALVLLAELK
jgi:hypothetical protein